MSGDTELGFRELLRKSIVDGIQIENPVILGEVISGAIGQATALEFRQFMEILDTLPDLDQIEKDPRSVPQPNNQSACYAIVGALSERGRNESTLRNVMEYVSRMTAEYRVLWSEIWHKKNPNMLHTKEWTQWVLKHDGILTI